MASMYVVYTWVFTQVGGKGRGLFSLVPRLSPSSLFYTRDFICTKLLWREKGGGEPGRLWSSADTDDVFSACPLCQLMRVQKNEKETWISVLVGFLECSTDGSIDGKDYQPTFWRLALLNLRQCQWVGCHDPIMIVLRDSRAQGIKMLAGSLVHRSSHLWSTPKSLY